MTDETQDAAPASSGVKKAEESLDEAIDESFPASDPESSWSGLPDPDPERTGDEPA
jgi:hypothetical protein